MCGAAESTPSSSSSSSSCPPTATAAGTKRKAPPSAAEVVASFKSSDSDSDTMKLTVSNEDYATPPASLGSGLYEWRYNVEPERNNYLEVSLVDDT